jgi:hypothetical protein
MMVCGDQDSEQLELYCLCAGLVPALYEYRTPDEEEA